MMGNFNFIHFSWKPHLTKKESSTKPILHSSNKLKNTNGKTAVSDLALSYKDKIKLLKEHERRAFGERKVTEFTKPEMGR